MGCASSRRVEVAGDVYRLAPTSLAVFDIHAIEEPWRTANGHAQQEHDGKNSHVSELILEKLNPIEDATEAPQSWAEVNKALQTLKPILDTNIHPIPLPSSPQPPPKAEARMEQKQRENLSFHTVEELDAKLNVNPTPKTTQIQQRLELKTEPESLAVSAQSHRTESPDSGFRPIKENLFLVRDRLEREKEGRQAILDKMMSLRRNPLLEFPEKCPPGGSDTLVIYTTSLGGIRRTFEDCNQVRDILEWHRAVYDERDVSLHGDYLKEWKELLGEGGRLPSLFVKGRYVGGAEEVVELNETGRLGRILTAARVHRGVGRQACVGCGGARFVPCFECGGSGWMAGGESEDEDGKPSKTTKKGRCPKCNENGLVHCPACLLL